MIWASTMGVAAGILAILAYGHVISGQVAVLIFLLFAACLVYLVFIWPEHRLRWARVKGRQNVIPMAKSGKRTMSASARRKIAAAQRARWAKVRQQKKAA
jgi:hypothetical protein